MCIDVEKLAEKLDGLAHPIRLRIVYLLAREGRSMYLSEIASRLGISRALAKIHLKKLEKAGIVKSSVYLLEEEARALRFYKLVDFHIEISPKKLVEEGICNESR
ncbi:MAG: ArsR family transcriptional regulator [Thermoprotei archaeon]